MANVTFISAEDTLYAYLSGEIDHDAAQRLRIGIDTTVSDRMPQVLVLDFSGVGFMDSSGIGLILGRQRRMQALGGKVRIQHPPEQIKKMLSLAKIECREV